MLPKPARRLAMGMPGGQAGRQRHRIAPWARQRGAAPGCVQPVAVAVRIIVSLPLSRDSLAITACDPFKMWSRNTSSLKTYFIASTWAARRNAVASRLRGGLLGPMRAAARRVRSPGFVAILQRRFRECPGLVRTSPTPKADPFPSFRPAGRGALQNSPRWMIVLTLAGRAFCDAGCRLNDIMREPPR